MTSTYLSRVEGWLMRQLLAAIGDPAVSIVLPDGSEIATAAKPATSQMTIHSHRALFGLAINPLFQFPKGYASGTIEVDGLEELLIAAMNCFNRTDFKGSWRDSIWRNMQLPRGNSLSRSRANIYQHYDIGNEFYRLWLDPQMIYTCAYFAEPSYSLAQAQEAKLKHVCRKLRLCPGMDVIEAGCGWGALAIYMAKHYGVNVRAFNISREQIDYAREQLQRQGLAGRVEFIEDDWRNISGSCDAFVSVGMLEHVGTKNYRRLGRVIDACLKPQGIGLIHSIGQDAPRPMNPWIAQVIFPGAYPPSLGEMMDIFEPRGFSVLDVENLRFHYAETLRHWLQRYEDSIDIVRAQFDEQFVRTWRLYLTCSMVAFICGGLQLFQVVFAHRTKSDVPRTRQFLYPYSGRVVVHRDGSRSRATPHPRVKSEATTHGASK